MGRAGSIDIRPCCDRSIVVWASVGAALRSWLLQGQRLRFFNITMGLLLAATALWMA